VSGRQASPKEEKKRKEERKANKTDEQHQYFECSAVVSRHLTIVVRAKKVMVIVVGRGTRRNKRSTFSRRLALQRSRGSERTKVRRKRPTYYSGVADKTSKQAAAAATQQQQRHDPAAIIIIMVVVAATANATGTCNVQQEISVCMRQHPKSNTNTDH
jgi:K+-sensing histidine kinase KdpD